MEVFSMLQVIVFKIKNLREDQVVKHTNTGESVLYHVRKINNNSLVDFALYLDPLIKPKPYFSFFLGSEKVDCLKQTYWLPYYPESF